MLEYIKDSKMLLTEEVYSALVTAYGRTGYVIAIFIIIMWEMHWPKDWWAGVGGGGGEVMMVLGVVWGRNLVWQFLINSCIFSSTETLRVPKVCLTSWGKCKYFLHPMFLSLVVIRKWKKSTMYVLIWVGSWNEFALRKG